MVAGEVRSTFFSAYIRKRVANICIWKGGPIWDVILSVVDFDVTELARDASIVVGEEEEEVEGEEEVEVEEESESVEEETSSLSLSPPPRTQSIIVDRS